MYATRIAFFAAAAVLFGQEPALDTRVLELNRQVLQTRAADPAALENRLLLLERLMREDPAAAARAVLAPDAVEALAPEAAGALETHGAWAGVYETFVEDDFHARATRRHRRLRTAHGSLDLAFAAAEPGWSNGDRVSLKGVRAGNTVLVAEAGGDGSTGAIPAQAAVCSPTGPQKIATLLVNLKDYRLPSSITADYLNGVLYGNAYTTRTNTPNWSVDDYWQQNSDGQASAPYASGKVVGPLTLPGNYNTDWQGGSMCDFENLRLAAIAAADNQINFADYNRVLIVFPGNGACTWAGVSSVGCMGQSSPGDGAFTASATWLRAEQIGTRALAVQLATHELGHGLGLEHAASREFAGPPRETLGALGAGGLTADYGDSFSAMGAWNFGHYAAPHAQTRLGWLSASNYAVVETSGQYTIHAYEARNASALLKALKIRRGAGNDAWVWAEFRTNTGIYDSQLNSQAWSGALLHYEDALTGGKTNLADFTASTSSFADPALAVGQTWTDAYSNLSITVNSIVNNTLTVTVNYGPTTCVRANPLVTLSPPNPSVTPGGSAVYTVSVTNRNSFACPAATFLLSATLPGGFTGSFGPPLIALASGAAGTASLTVTAGTAPGTYPISATAAEGSFSGSGSASCTVTAPANYTVTAATDKAVYAPRANVVVSSMVTNHGAPLAGIPVRFTIVKPGGATSSRTVQAGTNGRAVWSYSLANRDPNGAYKVTASATIASGSYVSPAASFTVAP